MRKTTANLYLASAIFVVACITYVFIYMDGERKTTRGYGEWVEHSRAIVLVTEKMLGHFEGSLAEQRGYILTGDPDFSGKFTKKTNELVALLNKLDQMTVDNPDQNDRVQQLKVIANQYIALLQDRQQYFSEPNSLLLEHTSPVLGFWQGVQMIENLHRQFYLTTDDFLNTEQKLLSRRLTEYNERRQSYSENFAVSLIGACVLIIFSNWIVLMSQRRYLVEKESAKLIDNRYRVAVRATNDGIFDWAIDSREIFLSSQIFKMCGYDFKDYEGSLEGLFLHTKGKNPLDLIHPDDIQSFNSNLQLFQERKSSDYDSIFRVKHAKGHWIWVHARGGGIFKQDGSPHRLIGSHTDITASKLMEERLRIEKEAADNSSKMKMEFLSHMSHEIRTPLTTISGVAEILQRSSSTFSDKEKSLIKTLNTSARTLKELVNDVLDFSRIENGDIKIVNDTVLIGNLFEQIISIMSVQAIERNIAFVSNHANLSDIAIDGDEARLRQILLNLCGNAIKFTETGSVTIEPRLTRIEAAEQSDMYELRIEVVDTGIGIGAADIPKVFDRFFQVDGTVSKKYKGTGLGLPISKKLAEAMNGDVLVESREGEGSTFSLVIPVHVLNPKELKVKEEPRSHIARDAHKAVAAANENKHILLVEDYEGNVIVIGYMLEDLGYSYDVAHNGKEAVEKRKDRAYDAILMDIQMPVMDGITATTLIRKLEKDGSADHGHVPIIGMTAHATNQDMQRCLDAGMDAYISKPLNHAEFIKKLEEVAA